MLVWIFIFIIALFLLYDVDITGMLSSSLVANIGAQHRQVENGFVEVLDGPTGFMVITRKAFEKMHEKYKDL